ncbi:hypothetical protein [Photobacterium sanguinicancri]|uniref:hypothetical protein n=1 Tax=Photobacterium sanguinicancri TaxID=875932 RepID=UPI0026E34D88|nr:hypothetical protein [Photobacterium sanguinicancri]MDO6496778.1 hypothetical protein [Photobacterium sanguinicancri]
MKPNEFILLFKGLLKDCQQVLQVMSIVVFFFCIKFFYELDYTQFILNNALMPWGGDQHTDGESLFFFGSSLFSYVIFILIIIKLSEWLELKLGWHQGVLTAIKWVAYIAIALSIFFEYNGQGWWVINFILIPPVFILMMKSNSSLL